MKLRRGEWVTGPFGRQVIEWRLRDWQLVQAALAGVAMHVDAKARKRQQKYGMDKTLNQWDGHIESLAAEMVVAQFVNRYWDGSIGVPGKGDVGKVEVRWGQREDGFLRMHDDDDPEHPFVHVIGRGGVYQMTGWMMGAEGMQQQWWKDPYGGRPCFLIPQTEIHPMETWEYRDEWDA